MISDINHPLINENINDVILIRNEFLNEKSQIKNNTLYKQIVRDLCNMGFELDIIDMCFCFNNIDSTEQAINLMTKEDGVWQHNYIEAENKLCIICKEFSDHLNFTISYDNRISRLKEERESLNIKLNRSSIGSIMIKSKNASEENLLEKNYNERICQVCMDTYVENFSLVCQHEFCNTCWEEYLKDKIINSEVINITCMMKNCINIIPDDIIKNFVTNELFVKYKKFQKNKMILKNKEMKFCPIPNCESFASKNSNKFVKCDNGHKFCYDCLKAWHKKRKCEDILDEEFAKWRKGKMIKKCISCGFWTDKYEGCNHITCKACSKEWCWICCKTYTNNHYSSNGPCPGLQYSNSKLYHYCFCRFLNRYFRKIGFVLMIIGIFIASLCFGSSILSVMWGINNTRYMSDFSRYFVLTILAITGLIFHPLLVLISSTILVLAIIFIIACFPLAIYIYKRYMR